MKEKVNFLAKSINDLPEIATVIKNNLHGYKIVLFEGEMGAGKTTFIRVFCHELGVTESVQSPTFSIINEYRTSQNDVIYHFDCYRLKSPIEALDFGIEEYLDSGNYCFIEWSSKIEGLLPDAVAVVHITEKTDGEREIILEFR